mmetsp:Transcript_18363/g.39878  ORF Transcript_18363/g.39878 Transcript_18363/m.39878 type:complete len:282 (+) Transcript_18363:182-1027(+)
MWAAYSKHGNSDHFNALSSIDRGTRLMYVHSYQSYVWNHMTSLRLERYSTQSAVEGDLVLSSPSADAPADDQDVADVRADAKVRVVSAEEAAAKTISIFDVVLPLVGTNVQYPTNTIGEEYGAFVKQHGLDLANLKRKNKDYSLPGGYRHIVSRPTDVSWSSRTYKSDYDDIQTSPLEKLRRKVEDRVPQRDDPHRAIILGFNLAPSQYATMCIRELLKQHSKSAFGPPPLDDATPGAAHEAVAGAKREKPDTTTEEEAVKTEPGAKREKQEEPAAVKMEP